MDVDSPQLSQKKRTKLKDNSAEKIQRKRKRLTSDDLELDSRTKKHKPDKQSNTKVVPGAALQYPPTSPFYQQTSSLYLPLPPVSQLHPLQGLCAEHLSPLILTYYPPFHGVITSYTNVRLSTNPRTELSNSAYARAVNEYAPSFVWLTADFLVFKPQRGNVLEGYVNLQNENHISLLCLNFFNATVERQRLPKEWKWIPGGMSAQKKSKPKKVAREGDSASGEGGESDAVAEDYTVEDAEGYFQDEHGKKVDSLMRFRVRNVETSKSMDRENGFLNIEGTMIDIREENDLRKDNVMDID